ncbi:MAG: hypothetical protein HY794_10775 [Desulfarculus sp.]|nr:hypothetical protein [Desulfarculus sp.]
MPSLDPRTIILVSMVIYVLLAMAMVLFSASLKHQRGPGYWALGTSGWALFSLLLFLRDILPDWLTIVVANQGLVASLCLVAQGLALLLGGRPPLAFHLAVSVVNLAGFLYFTYMLPSFSGRVVVFSLAIIVLGAEMARRLLPLRQRPNDPTRLLVLLTLLTCILAFSLRIALTLLDGGQGLLQDRVVNVVFLVFFPMSVVALIFSLLGLAASRFARQKDEANDNLAEVNAELARTNADQAETNSQLQEALDSVKTLSGLLPICANCKKIRDDRGYWLRIEAYLQEHTGADFTHSICPACAQELYGDFIKSRTVG